MQDMIEHARPAAELLKKQEKVLLVSHIDADGISAAGIASTVLDRLGITHETLFIKSIEPEAVKLISSKKSFTWFSDLGSGSMSLLKGINGIITDHHIPEKCEVAVADRGNILSYCKPVSGDLIQVNPHLCGHDGTSEISGAGTTFALALAVDERNKDLAALGIVGAVGDMQDQEKRRLVGLNQDILSIGQAEGVVVSEIDIRLFGRESRGLPKLLMFADPQIPGLTNESKAISFLSKTGVRLQNSRGWW
ncbi:MAG: DHH family phosphoesterase, partial [Candidatus Thermoplasmatota archaeon]|nr:DHH family phosphoesterase [Candidatus Thermoplasmatota archaeon]